MGQHLVPRHVPSVPADGQVVVLYPVTKRSVHCKRSTFGCVIYLAFWRKQLPLNQVQRNNRKFPAELGKTPRGVSELYRKRQRSWDCIVNCHECKVLHLEIR